LPERIPEANNKGIGITVSSLEYLNRLAERIPAPKKINIHLKIDTGMHRQGVFVSDVPNCLKILKRYKNIVPEGIYTHFAAAGEPALPQKILGQLNSFKEALALVKNEGFNPIRHCASTASTINFPATHFDMLRIGIGLYGLWPSEETRAVFSGKVSLKPVLSWKTIVGELKNLSKGSRIGYGFIEAVKRDSRVAILPIGYWHGYPLSLSSKAHVFIKGKRAKVLGRISMDMITVDVTGIKNVKVGDEVVLIGKSGEEEVSADHLADLAGTIKYEIITRLNPLIKRLYK
jgi:alanine racemase